jgi:hypothetical protein
MIRFPFKNLLFLNEPSIYIFVRLENLNHKCLFLMFLIKIIQNCVYSNISSEKG